MALQETQQVQTIRKNAPRLGKPLTNGKYIFDEWRRTYPDLGADDGDYVKPCSDAKFFGVVANDSVNITGLKTVDDYLDFIEVEYIKVIESLSGVDGRRRHKDTSSYLDSLMIMQKELLFAKIRFGGNNYVRLTQYARTNYKNRKSSFWQDNSKRSVNKV